MIITRPTRQMSRSEEPMGRSEEPVDKSHLRNLSRWGGVLATAALTLTIAACGSAGSGAAPSGVAPSSPASSHPGGISSAAGSSSSITGGSTNKLHASLPADIRSSGVIKVATDMNYPPLDYYGPDGKTPRGADYEVGQAIGALLGVKMDVSNVSFDNIIPGLASGQYQLGVTFMTDTVERQKTLDFINIYQDGSSILVKKGNPENIKSITDLCGKVATTTKTSIQIPLAQAQTDKCKKLGKGPIKILTVTTDTDAQLQVQSGRATADLADSVTAAYDAKTAGAGGKFEVVPGVYEPTPVGIVLSKNNTQLRDAVRAAAAELIANGTYGKILAKYGLESIAVKAVKINSATK